MSFFELSLVDFLNKGVPSVGASFWAEFSISESEPVAESISSNLGALVAMNPLLKLTGWTLMSSRFEDLDLDPLVCR